MYMHVTTWGVGNPPRMRNAEFEKRLRLMLSSNETKCAGTMAAASTELEAQREVQALLDAPRELPGAVSLLAACASFYLLCKM